MIRSGRDLNLWVNEVFGPTVQGEGPALGSAAMFVRLAHCSLRCVWCDTRYAWDWQQFSPREEAHARTTEDVWGEVDRRAGASRLLVITGGEPGLQANALSGLVALAKAEGWRVNLETAGVSLLTAVQDQLDLIVVSPKLANSGMPQARRLRYDILAQLAQLPQTVLKFVVQRPSDLEEVDTIVGQLTPRPVYVVPEGTDAGESMRLLARLAPHVIARNYILAPRLHVLMWGDERGM